MPVSDKTLRRRLRPILLALPLVAAACGQIPRDPDGTLDRVRQQRTFTVGRAVPQASAAGRLVLNRLQRATGAQARTRDGQLEPLLLALENKQLDLVVGARLDPKTPWTKRVTLSPPLDPPDADGTQEFVVTPNGENAWIMLVDRTVKTAVQRHD